jgi:hypothetical protein
VISLRYHVITIVSVFLALAVGTLVGGAFVQPVLQRQLEDRTEELQALNGQLREEIDALQAQGQSSNAFIDAALPYLIENRLLGVDVIVLAQAGVEDSLIGETQRSLRDAGADVIAVISARDEIASQDPETRTRLAEILGGTTGTADELPEALAEALAERLGEGYDGVDPEGDLLARLLSEGFLTPIGPGPSESTLAQIGLDGQVIVVLGGGPSEEPGISPERFLVPLVQGLSEREVPLAAGESATTVVRFVEQVRGTDGAVTVDDLDLAMGGAALVLGLDELLATGEGGAYGIKDGAAALPPRS